jgi:predicted nucleotidyltransferase
LERAPTIRGGVLSTEDVEGRLRRFFASDPRGALAVYLFGSVARGTARADSDVDVAVLLEEDPPRSLEGLPFPLEGALEDVLGARSGRGPQPGVT